jgi:hypothetical protein
MSSKGKKTCPSCGEQIQQAAVKCRFCGEVLSLQGTSVLAEVAAAEMKLRTLLLDIPAYARQFREIFHSPVRYFRLLDYVSKSIFRKSIAFMLQGVTLSFVILTMGWAMPQSLASFLATNVPLVFGTRKDLADYSRRIQELRKALPSSLASEWFRQGELMLAVRTLPEDRFQRMLDRLRDLSEKNPDLLESAIKGSLIYGGRFGGRGYVLSFFMALDPRMGALLQQTRQIVDIGPKYELKPHVDFLLRAILLWYLTCYAVSLFLPKAQSGGGETSAAFVIGAYLLGSLGPVFQAFRTLVNLYLAVVLPKYIEKASLLLQNPAASDLGLVTSGVFPFENLLLAVVNMAVPLAVVVFAVLAFVNGIKTAREISETRAWTAACLGMSIGLGLTEAAAHLAVMVLAPTGLL